MWKFIHMQFWQNPGRGRVAGLCIIQDKIDQNSGMPLTLYKEFYSSKGNIFQFFKDTI